MAETNYKEILNSLRSIDLNLTTINKVSSLLTIIGAEEVTPLDSASLAGVFERIDNAEMFVALATMISLFINLKMNGQHILEDLSTTMEAKGGELTNEEIFSIIQANVASPRS